MVAAMVGPLRRFDPQVDCVIELGLGYPDQRTTLAPAAVCWPRRLFSLLNPICYDCAFNNITSNCTFTNGCNY